MFVFVLERDAMLTGCSGRVTWRTLMAFTKTAPLSVLVALVLALLGLPARAVIRDGGIDPANLGKGDWIYFMSTATNKLGGNVAGVTNEASLMLWYKSQGIRYLIIKAATDDFLFNGSYATPQFTSNLVNIARTNGILIFGYNRSYGDNIPGEIAISDYVFNQGADGFVWDAESEWESNQPWITTNGPAKAWTLCSTVRSNWPNKFLAHAPFDIISFHASFPYKEFGYWCDAVMPQIYHFARTGIKSRTSGNINWADANWQNWQNNLATLPPTNINGLTVYWTNAIKPLAPVNHVYGPNPPNAGVSEIPPSHVMEFVDYLLCDPNSVTAGGYKGASFWRADLHGVAQWTNIQAATIGDFPGIVNNLVLDSPQGKPVGAWTSVRTFSNGAFFGNGSGTDTNSFGTNYLTKGPGVGTAYVEFVPNVVVPGDYDVYQWHPSLTNASASVPHLITHHGGATTVNANQQTNDGNWSWLGRFNFATGTNGNIRVLDNFPEPGGVAVADGIKLVLFSATLPPVIVQHPPDRIVTAGQDASFSVTASGSAPLAYQWRFNNTNLAGATNSSYTRPAVQTNDAGNFRVVITNALGAITSNPALLTVNYSLSTGTLPGGSVLRSPDQTNYTPGTIVTLTATPHPGFAFFSWIGDVTGTNNPLAVTLATNQATTAIFLNTNTDIILDNTNAAVTFAGNWQSGTSSPDKYLADYRFASTLAGGISNATYRPAIGVPGYYDVFIWYPQGSNRATNAPWSVGYEGGSTNLAVDQTVNGGGWRLLAAARPFPAGTNGYVRLANDTGYAGKVVMADAVRFAFVGPLNVPPEITAHPQSQTAKVGTNVTFTVTTTGTPAPAYQWRLANTNLPGATSSNYTRFNVQAADAGDYSVTVSNLAGSVTSSNAVLTVSLPAPLQFQSITRLSDGRLRLVVSGEPGAGLWIDRAALLPDWLELTNFFNTNGTVEFTDDSAITNGQRFYRARQ